MEDLENIIIIQKIFGFSILSTIVSFVLAPFVIKFLHAFSVIKGAKLETKDKDILKNKHTTPTMGGLLPIMVIGLITYSFNWDRSFTWVPIGVMAISATLGGLDDFYNIFGTERRIRSIKQTLRLIKIHKSYFMRFWYIITLPWTALKRFALLFGSNTIQIKGVLVHEKLILQFVAGAITAWWIYFKLGEYWQTVSIPFVEGSLDIGLLLVPVIIFIVMFTANAVNIADGMDGLAGGMLISTFSALTFISGILGFEELAYLNATVVGAMITYTYYNVRPAKFHMGDIGSLGLGALLAINAIAIDKIIVLFLLAFVFYIEAFSVIIQVAGRYITGRRIFKMTPIHYHFELIGWSEEKVVMRFWLINLVFIIIGIWLAMH